MVALAAMIAPAVALPAAADGAVTSIASGGSIVFARDHNIWLSSPDGLTERALTTNGTASTPYHTPTQSAAGTVIVAVHDHKGRRAGDSRLYVMDRQGTLLNRPFAPAQYTTVPGEGCPHGVRELGNGVVAAVSPDGTKIMVNKLGRFFSPFGNFCGGLAMSEVSVINLDGTPAHGSIRPADGAAPLSLEEAAWAGNSRLLMRTGNFGGDLSTGIFYYDLGAATARVWIKARYDLPGQSDLVYRSPAIAGDRLASTGHSTGVRPVLRLWTTSAPIPAPPARRCEIVSPEHPGYEPDFEFTGATLAADASAVAWVEADVDVFRVPTNSAIYVSPVGDIATGDCSSVNRQLLIAGGTDPDWGGAPVGPAGSPGTLPRCPPEQPGTPPDCNAPSPACPAGQTGSPPHCTSPQPPAGQPPSSSPTGGQPPAPPAAAATKAETRDGPTTRIVRVVIEKLRRGCSREQLKVSGRGVKIIATKRLSRSRCRLTLRVAGAAKGRRNLLVMRGKRKIRLVGAIRL